ncbi:uncharacterized protein LOC127709547 [Mytilus californianus]|uniref:uncharacterized protein LOC127709547 n=1 Tax=Mytilus californianus TaxID=6549 RepID=UPI0022468A60|nr:uncharacterized protein LOC127709547 [Mytilus californianus]
MVWYSSGSNIISYEDCDTVTRSDCPQQSKKIHMPDASFTADDDIDFSAAETVPNRGYSVKLSTANNTELVLSPIQNETELEENTPVGYKVLYFDVTDTDVNDNITWTLTGQHELFTMSEIKNEKVTLNLQTKLPSGGGLTYVITVTGTDSCQHTATATVTVASYNAPPIINNLPSIHEISESTKSTIFLYTINVTDATYDPLCCTLSYTLPNSYNFQFKEENGGM